MRGDYGSLAVDYLLLNEVEMDVALSTDRTTPQYRASSRYYGIDSEPLKETFVISGTLTVSF